MNKNIGRRDVGKKQTWPRHPAFIVRVVTAPENPAKVQHFGQIKPPSDPLEGNGHTEY